MTVAARAAAPPHLILVNGSPMGSVGGVQIFSLALLRYAAERGHAATVVTTAARGERFAGDVAGVPAFRLHGPSLVRGRVPIPVVPFELARVVAHVRRTRGAVVVVQTRLYPLGLFAALAARAAGRRCFVIEHGSGHIPAGGRAAGALSVAYEHAATALMRAAGARFFGVSPASSRWLEHFGIRRAPVVANGVDDALLALRPNGDAGTPFVAAFAGRLIPEKGIADLLDAFADLERRRPGAFRLEIVGEGPLLARARAAEAASPGVVVHGPLAHDATMRVVASADAFVSPTVYPEGFNRGLIEAGALGLPVIATRKGETALLDDGATALVVPAGDPAAIAAALERLCDAPELARTLGSAIRERVRARYRWSETLQPLWDAVAGASSPQSPPC